MARMTEAEQPAVEPQQPAPPRRICRTPEESFQAGWDDGAHDRPLSPAEIAYLATLWRPYFRRNAA